MKKAFFTLLILLSFGLLAQAQNISVKDFYYAENDLTARTHGTKVEDQNGYLCALIKVRTTEKGMWTFDVGMLGVTKTEMQNASHSAEIWVYVPFGVTRMTIQHEKLGILDKWPFPCSIEKGCTYVMELTTGKVITVVEEVVNQQYLAFQITPADAVLEVNGKIWEVDADGNAQEYVSFGSYEYRVQATNYHPAVGKVNVNDPDNTVLMSVTLNPNFGWIEVGGTGDLHGASVYIDNALIGKAPCKSNALKSGQHTVRIAKKMYDTYSATVTVSDNQTTTVNPVLEANFSNVTLSVDADAEIWVNNERKGVRTWTGALGYGSYKVECKQASHETSLTTLEITAAMNGATLPLPAPTPIYGSLNVESTPKFCRLYIDSKDMGTTPKSVNQILIGQHEIRLTKEGYAEHKETVTITKGERKQVTATMSNERGEEPTGEEPNIPIIGVTDTQQNLKKKKTYNNPMYRPKGGSIRISAGFPTLGTLEYNYQVNSYFMMGGGVGFGLKAYERSEYEFYEPTYSVMNYFEDGGTWGVPLFAEVEVRTPRYKWSVFINLKVGANIGIGLNIPKDTILESNPSTCYVYTPRTLYIVTTAGFGFKNFSLGIQWNNFATKWDNITNYGILLSYNIPFK